MIDEVFASLVDEAIVLLGIHENHTRATLSSREIQSAVRLVLPGEVAKHAVAEGTKAVSKFCSSTGGPASARAGLVFPVAHVKNLIKSKARTRVGKGAPIYLAAVLEYLTAEVLELAGNAARDNQLCRITPRHIMLAIRSDEELDRLFKGNFPNGGVVPHIHNALISKPNKVKVSGGFGGFGSGVKNTDDGSDDVSLAMKVTLAMKRKDKILVQDLMSKGATALASKKR
jgi:histone H2A